MLKRLGFSSCFAAVALAAGCGGDSSSSSRPAADDPIPAANALIRAVTTGDATAACALLSAESRTVAQAVSETVSSTCGDVTIDLNRRLKGGKVTNVRRQSVPEPPDAKKVEYADVTVTAGGSDIVVTLRLERGKWKLQQSQQ